MIDVRLNGARGTFRLNAALSVPAQGITVVRGASGSGKTSLLRAIAGLDRMAGHVRIAGDTWQDEDVFVPPHRRRIGYVFQEASLFAHHNVRGNLDYARSRAIEPVDFDGIVSGLGIAHLLDRTIHDLSGGERQRVAVARALMAAPKVLLMDEPLSSLDRTARDGILPLIKQLGQGLPMVYVTHDPAEAMALADRVLRMDGGKIMPDDALFSSLDGLSQTEIEQLAVAALRLGISPQPE
jgi:molybdate transport system ATP-binding protein